MSKQTHPYKLVIGEQANHILIAIIRRNHIEPEHLLRAMVETDLSSCSEDEEIEDTLVEDARTIKQTGALSGYWPERPERHDSLFVDYDLGQEEAPDDVPAIWQDGPPSPIRGRWGDVWLSPEYVCWCKRNHFRPEGLGRCVLYSFALENPKEIIIRSDNPVNADDVYDLDGLAEG